MKLISFDIETWGLKDGYTLQPWRVHTGEAGILTIAISDPTKRETIVGRYPTRAELMRYLSVFDREDILCGWNLKFDLSFLLAYGLRYPLQKYRFLDGMLLLKRLGLNLPSYGLKQSLIHFQEHLKNVDVDYSQDIEFKIGNPHEVYTKNELEKMATYNARDSEYTMQLINHLISISPVETIRQAMRESTASFLFADIWQRGIDIDRDELDKYTKEMSNKCTKLSKVMGDVGLTPKIIASPVQLQTYLIGRGIKLTEKTEKGNYTVGASTLKNLYYNTEGINKSILRLISDYKEFKTEQSKFVNATHKCLETNEKLHPSPILSGTYTGRLTYSMYQNTKIKKTFKNGNVKDVNKKLQIGIPLHQIKKTGSVRNLFVPPENHSLVELDFCAQEMRLIACIANEATMIKLFNENKDMHAYTAAGIVGMPYDDFVALKQTDPQKYENSRKLGKLTNLALQYRLGANGLYRQWHDVYGLIDKTFDDAQIARNTYLRLYPGIPRYWRTNPTLAKEQGFVDSKGHRRCSITQWDLDNDYKSTQTAINFPIQATGADQKILALYCLRNFLFSNNIQFAWDLHDGMFFYVPDNLAHTRVTEMMYILNELPYEKAWGWKPQVAFPVEAKIGKSWGKLEAI